MAVLLIMSIKYLLAVPHLIILGVYTWIAGIAAWIAQWIVLFTGRYPAGFHAFVLGSLRWTWNVNAWLSGIVDKYPPFSADADRGYPATATCDRAEKYSRGLAIARILAFPLAIILIPHFIALGVLGLLWLIAFVMGPWATILTGGYSRLSYEIIVGVQRWQHRFSCYMLGLVDAYPPFRTWP